MSNRNYLQRIACFVALVLFANGAGLHAAVIIGAGDISGNGTLAPDTGTPYVAVDESHPMILAAGIYSATLFNHQFLQASGGSVVPALEISNGTGGYHTIAVGATLTDSATESAFTSTAFGGSNVFTVGPGGETVYAAVYQSTTGMANAPVEFLATLAAGATTDLYYNNGVGHANVPVVGSDLSVTAGGGLLDIQRTYDFSITLRSIPEPSSFILCGLGALGLFIAARRRRRA